MIIKTKLITPLMIGFMPTINKKSSYSGADKSLKPYSCGCIIKGNHKTIAKIIMLIECIKCPDLKSRINNYLLIKDRNQCLF